MKRVSRHPSMLAPPADDIVLDVVAHPPPEQEASDIYSTLPAVLDVSVKKVRLEHLRDYISASKLGDNAEFQQEFSVRL